MAVPRAHERPLGAVPAPLADQSDLLQPLLGGHRAHLAEDEEHHYAYIERQVNELKAGKTWVHIPELDKVEPVDAKAPIFPAGKQAPEVLQAKPSLEDALLFGLDTEIKSYELYKNCSLEIDNPEAKQMFEKLAAAERGHFDTLMMRYESHFGYPR